MSLGSVCQKYEVEVHSAKVFPQVDVHYLWVSSVPRESLQIFTQVLKFCSTLFVLMILVNNL